MMITVLLSATAFSQIAFSESAQGFSVLKHCAELFNGPASEAEITVKGDGVLIIGSDEDTWYLNGGFVCDEKVKVDGLKIVVSAEFDCMNNSIDINCYFGINLSATKPTEIKPNGMVGERTAGVDATDGFITALARLGNNSAGFVTQYGGMGYGWKTGYVNGTEVTLEFTVTEQGISVKANDVFLKKDAYSVDKSFLDADGMAYLSFNVQGYERASVRGTVKSINGIAANAYFPSVSDFDFDSDGELNDSDVLYLLYHVFFPEDYPVTADCDFTGDGEVTDADVIYFLYHIYFPEDYPIALPDDKKRA